MDKEWMVSNVTRLGIVTLFGNFLAFIFRTYLVLYLEIDLLASAVVLSILVSLVNLLQIPFRVPLSELSQVLGRKPLIVSGIALYTIAIFFLFIATDWRLALVSVISFGIGMSCFWPATFAFLGDIAKGDYGKSNGRIFQSGDIGVIGGSLLAKVVLDELEFNLKALFFISFIVGVVFVLTSTVILPEVISKEHQIKTSNKPLYFLESVKSMWKTFIANSSNQHLRKVYLLQLLIAFTEFGFLAFFPTLFVKYGYSKGQVGEMTLYATSILFLFKPLLGSLADRFNFLGIVAFSMTINAIIIYATTLVTEFWVLTFLYIGFVAGMLSAYPAVNSATANNAGSKQRGSALGVLGVYVSLGRAISTMFVGFLYDFFPLEGAFQIFSITILTGIGVIVFLVGKEKTISIGAVPN